MRQLFLITVLFLLTACTSSSFSTVNGIYSGGIYDNEVGFLGGFAINVSTSGSSVEGTACFAAITGDVACNTLSGDIDNKRFRFTVGLISFDTTISGGQINGTYTSSAGSGVIELTKDDGSSISVYGQGDKRHFLQAKEVLEVFRR